VDTGGTRAVATWIGGLAAHLIGPTRHQAQVDTGSTRALATRHPTPRAHAGVDPADTGSTRALATRHPTPRAHASTDHGRIYRDRA
jgi:hypothetical protein